MDNKGSRVLKAGLQGLASPAYGRVGDRTRSAFKYMSWSLAVILAVLVLWDLALTLNTTENDTWSEQTRLAADRWPVLPWFIGSLIGHLFPPRHEPLLDRDTGTGMMNVLTGLMMAWSIGINLSHGRLASQIYMWLLASAGMAAAFVLWPSAEAQKGESS